MTFLTYADMCVPTIFRQYTISRIHVVGIGLVNDVATECNVVVYFVNTSNKIDWALFMEKRVLHWEQVR